MMKYGTPMVASSGFVARPDTRKCDACGKCEKACPFNAVTVDKTAAVTWERCMGCGVCEGLCPNGAMSLVRDEKKGATFDVRLIA